MSRNRKQNLGNENISQETDEAVQQEQVFQQNFFVPTHPLVFVGMVVWIRLYHTKVSIFQSSAMVCT